MMVIDFKSSPVYRESIKAYRFIKHFINCMRYCGEIRKFRFNGDLDELVGHTFKSWGCVLKPLQIRDEIKLFLQLVQHKKPRYVLEIGTANGGTLFMLSRCADSEACIISIDFPVSWRAYLYSLIRTRFIRCIHVDGQRLFLIKSDSQALATRQKVEKILNGEKLDLLYINADHSYEGVKRDFELYSPIVKNDGIIALHDIVHHPPDSVPLPVEVDKIWQEVKPHYPYVEIVKNWGQ